MTKKPLDQDPDFEEGNHEGDIYDEEGREKLQEEDEITSEEEGFVEGFEEGDIQARCAECGKIFTDIDESEIIEEEINGKHCRFCSDECVKAYEVGKKRK